MYKTSYDEITSTCKLTDFRHVAGMWIEEWVDPHYTYTCMWYESNDTFVPSTITNKKHVN